MLSIPDFFRKLRRETSTGEVGAGRPEWLEQGEDCASTFVQLLEVIIFLLI
jgi:hypothetical protein